MRPSLVAGLVVGIGLPVLVSAQTQGTVKPAGKEPTLAIGGLIQAQFDVGDRGDSRFSNDNDRFYLRRARLNATGKFLEEFDFRLEMDLAGSLSNTSALRAQMTDGFITWNRYVEASVRVGQFKTPFGFEQLYGDPRLYAIERSLANDRLTLSRQIGAQVAGEFFEKRLTYALGAFNGNAVNNNFNDDDRFLDVGRLVVVPWQGKLGSTSATWSLGGNGFSSKDTNVPLADLGVDSTPTTSDRDGIFTGERQGLGVDTQLIAGPLEIWVEYLSVHFEPESRIPRSELDADGGYVQATWFFLPDRFQALLKYETFDPNTEREEDETDTVTVGASYYVKGHDIKLMLNYLRTDAPGPLESQDKVIARLQVIF